MPTSAASAPLLTDGTVTLRRHTAADVDGILGQSTDFQSQRWTNVARGYARADAVAFLEHITGEWENPKGRRYWAIEVTAADGRPSYGGTIDLRPGEAWDHASIGFGLHPEARGRGAMSRAVRLLAVHAFEHGPWGRPLGRIHWRAIAGNWDSRRVAWATGFTFHGTLPGTHPNVMDPSGPALDCWYASLAAGEPMHPAIPWLEPVALEDGNIRLRAFRESDIGALERRNDPEHWFPQQALLSPDTFEAWLARRLEHMASGSGIEWAIADSGTDRALGHLTVFVRNGTLTGDVAEIGYQLVPSARGRGAAKAACGLAITYAFTPRGDGGLGLRRLVAETAADNVASNAVLRALGFTEFGRERATDLLPDGAYGDALHWQLLR